MSHPTPSEILARVEEIQFRLSQSTAPGDVEFATNAPMDVAYLCCQLRTALQDTQPTEQQVEQAARAICDEWGYDWDCTDPEDGQCCGDDNCLYDERPSKALFRRAARKALAALSSTHAGPQT